MNRVGDTMVARRNDVRTSFEFRAEGGDDRTMAWTKVEVVEPPRLASLAIVTHPPAYTGLPAAAAERHLEVLAGTGIEVIGMADQSLGAARIVAGDKTIAAKLVADSAGHERRGFTIPADAWIATTSGKYRLELESTDGVAGTVAEGNLQVVPDTPPTVSWERPHDDLMVLSTATVPIEVSVKDNLAIASVELRYSRSDQADAKLPAIEIYRGPESIAPADAVAAQQHGESRDVEFDWSLEPLKLPEGTQLTVNVAASDYRPGTGQTATPRRITVVSREQLEARLAGEQAQIARRLAEALKLQQATRDDVHGLEIQLRDAGQLAAADRDTLSAAEANQRRVGRSLVAPADGVAAQAETVLGGAGDEWNHGRRFAATDGRSQAGARRACGGAAPDGGARIVVGSKDGGVIEGLASPVEIAGRRGRQSGGVDRGTTTNAQRNGRRGRLRSIGSRSRAIAGGSARTSEGDP